jgi:hypothetical protein
MKRRNGRYTSKTFVVAVGRALRRARSVARKTARAHGTPIYIWRDGKVVAQNHKARRIRKTLLTRLSFQEREEPVQETGALINLVKPDATLSLMSAAFSTL